MSSQSNSFIKLSRNVINVINGLYAVITVIISYFLYFFAPSTAFYAFILSVYFLFLIPTLIISLVFTVITLNKWIALLLLPNVLIVAVFVMPYFTPKPEVFASPDEIIRVMSYNVKNLSDERTIHANLVNEISPDIVAFQEFSDFVYYRWQDDNQLADYPYIAIGEVDGVSIPGQAVYSRYPILDEEVWVYESSSSHPHQRVLLDVNGTEVALYNIHPNPPIDWAGGAIFRANEADITAHSLAMQDLTQRIIAETIPVIVVGDMNMSDKFPEYLTLSSYLTDSFLSSGYGFGFTYPAGTAFPELMRLDYIFHNSAFQTVDASVVRDTETSDHLPVVAELRFVGQ